MLPWPSSSILDLNDSAILNLHFTLMPRIKFRLNLTFEEFQDGRRGRHLGYRNGNILAILTFCVTVMPPIKFQLNRTGFRRRCRLKNFKMADLAAILNIGTELFSNFESLCHCDASHQASVQSNLGFERRCRLKNFKMAAVMAILDIGM